MATKFNLKVDQGSNFEIDLAITDTDGVALDTTGYTGYGAFKKSYYANTGTDFAVAVANGIVTLSLTPSDTASLREGLYVYDVFIKNAVANNTLKIFEGILHLGAKVTTVP